jgi:predicted nucleic acid-binding protein
VNGGRRLVLDTTALSVLLDERKPGHEEAQLAFERILAEDPTPGSAVIVPTLVVYEAIRGLLSAGALRRIHDLTRFLRSFAHVSGFDESHARNAAILWNDRKQRGETAGEIDLMILACAVSHQADVVTLDTRFPTAEGVSVLSWADLVAEEGGDLGQGAGSAPE